MPEPVETEDRLTSLVSPAYPLRPSKYEIPLLPDETLHRDRLLDWLNVKIHRRAIFVVAEAGFGKTTLLADFARSTRLRVAWYRLDDDETDGLLFLRYFVAACRRMDPHVFPGSAALLADTISPPTCDSVLRMLLTEIAPLGAEPTVLVFDDFHSGEAVPAIRDITETLLAKAPERVTFVFASRRQPRLSVSRLRVHDELAELERDDLRFEEAEAERLFRETYRHPLDPDVMHDLMARTEGWPASLQLVKEAVKRRTPAETRAFVRLLDGAQGDLYDYLAEEVVSELPAELRHFLTRIALLEDVDPSIAGALVEITETQTVSLVAAAEQHGLLSKGGPLAVRRFHPLVRDFLVARLRAEIGPEGVADLHRTIARLEEPRSWRRAAHHWAEAGDAPEVCRVIEEAAATIIGTGECDAADTFIARFAPPDPNPYFDIIRSRLAFARGQRDIGLELAERASATFRSSSNDNPMLAQLEARHAVYARQKQSLETALNDSNLSRLASSSVSEEGRAVAAATIAQVDATRSGKLAAWIQAVERLASVSQRLGHTRDEGLAYASLQRAEFERGRMLEAEDLSRKAEALLRRAGYPDEIAYVLVGRAAVEAHLGKWEAAKADIASALNESEDPPTVIEAAEVLAVYGDPADSMRLLDRSASPAAPDGSDVIAGLIRARASAFAGGEEDLEAALDAGARTSLAWSVYRTRACTIAAFVRAVRHTDNAAVTADAARRMALAQGATYQATIARLIAAVGLPAAAMGAEISATAAADPGYLTTVCELLVGRLDVLDGRAMALVHLAARAHPDKWRYALRQLLNGTRTERPSVAAAELLEAVGEQADVVLLRSIARRTRRGLGKALIRRLAPRIYVDDLGPVIIHIGGRDVLASDIRRKTAALLCFLLTKTKFSTTCDQALDALWPELDPPTAMNSLNQTVYFLRRVLELKYSESLSAGYLRHEGDLIWLDPALVTTRSQECLRLIESRRSDASPEIAVRLAEAYTGRFALDFEYEDWASDYRDGLHSGYLRVIESAVQLDMDNGEYPRALQLAERVVQVDSTSDSLQLLLLRLYRLVGAHAAAAEQYARYATLLRSQFGVEPPPLDAL